MNTDFQILLSSNAALVIADFQRLQAVVLRTQALINQTSAASARVAGAGAGAGVGAAGGLVGAAGASAAAASPQVERLTKGLGGLQSQMRALSSVGIVPTLAQTRREMTLLQQITAAGGPSFGRFNTATGVAATNLAAINPAAAASAASLRQQRAALDNTGQSFERHSGRIAQTILLYAAFAAAVAGATSAVKLAATIDTESRRLEAVISPSGQGFGAAQSRQFVQGVQEVAIATATPQEQLLSVADQIASAFLGVPEGAERAAASLELLTNVGKITTVTQRDVAVETDNLISIMKQAQIPIADYADFLGKIVVAGGNSSVVIGRLLDALQLSAQGAKSTGTNFDTLIALEAAFISETQRTGTEVGGTFKTLFGKIADPSVAKAVDKITGGIIGIRDATGKIRDPISVLAELNATLDAGVISSTQFSDVMDALAPPLQPGAVNDLKLIAQLIRDLGPAARDVTNASSDALDKLVNKLNDALGPQFTIFIESVKKGFSDLFADDIINSGQTLIDLLRSLGDILKGMDPDLLRALGGLLAIAAAFKGITFVGGALLSLIGLGGITGALGTASAAALVAGKGFGFMSSMVLGLELVLSRVLPLLAIFAAIKFAQEVGAQQEGLKGIIGEQAVGLNAAELKAQRQRLVEQKGPGFSLSPFDESFVAGGPLLNVEGGLKSFSTDPAIAEGIAEYDRLLAELDERGAGARVTLEDLSGAFVGGADASTAITEAMAAQESEIERLTALYTEGAQAAASMTETQRIEIEAAALLEATRKGQANDLEKLGERLREGKISAEEFAQGQQIVAQAAELAAQLVATVGTRLGEYPLFAEAAAESNEALTARVYEMIVASGGSINAIGGLIGQLGNLAAANAAVAGSLAANPLVIKLAVQKVSSADLANNPELSAARRFAQTATGRSVSNPTGTTADVDRQIKAILNSINSLVGGAGAGSTAFGNVPSIPRAGTSGGAAATRIEQPDILDLGDFDAAKLADAIALAFRLQSSIPGASAAAAEETLNIIKDAEFLRQVQGLDDELLRKAIERLTDIEEARLALEKQRAPLLANLQVNQGGLSSLITQPVSFGTNGSFLGGTGFNSDPSQQGIVVNIGTISGQSLTSAQITQLMYDAISKALADSAKL